MTMCPKHDVEMKVIIKDLYFCSECDCSWHTNELRKLGYLRLSEIFKPDTLEGIEEPNELVDPNRLGWGEKD